jgi:hypothetical protein
VQRRGAASAFGTRDRLATDLADLQPWRNHFRREHAVAVDLALADEDLELLV